MGCLTAPPGSPFSPAYYIRGGEFRGFGKPERPVFGDFGEFRGKRVSISTCPECGDRFEKDAAWKKTCMPCWKASKRAEHDELLELREEVAERGRLLSEMLAERKAAAIEPEMLARLIRLCHPDKHNGSEASTTATQWLLAQREART
jgi:hypothetical protein